MTTVRDATRALRLAHELRRRSAIRDVVLDSLIVVLAGMVAPANRRDTSKRSTMRPNRKSPKRRPSA